MNNATDPELMPLHAVYALECECGVPVVTSAMAELNGRRLTDPDAKWMAAGGISSWPIPTWSERPAI